MKIAIWYVICAVVGAASSWIGGLFVAVGLTAMLLLCGGVMAFVGAQPRMFPFHHALIGLGLSLAISHLLPVAIFALGPGF